MTLDALKRENDELRAIVKGLMKLTIFTVNTTCPWCGRGYARYKDSGHREDCPWIIAKDACDKE